MPRQKADPLPSHPTNMSPKNNSSPGYSSEHSPDEPDQEVLSDDEESSSSSSESPPKEKRVTTSESGDDDLVTVSKESTPSPTASTILIRFELEDTFLAHEMNGKWVKKLSNAERAKKLNELLDICNTKTGEEKRAAVEEMKRLEEEDEEEQHEGKGKGKQV
ncbi:hypothetical protein J4E81_005188 [Alternaria sp. BMP 2799]|nr:hypothetical protein J4E81_005188 [Alternaria sp. BMP 2799]